jgi:hypothetical protein
VGSMCGERGLPLFSAPLGPASAFLTFNPHYQLTESCLDDEKSQAPCATGSPQIQTTY